MREVGMSGKSNNNHMRRMMYRNQDYSLCPLFISRIIALGNYLHTVRGETRLTRAMSDGAIQ